METSGLIKFDDEVDARTLHAPLLNLVRDSQVPGVTGKVTGVGGAELGVAVDAWQGDKSVMSITHLSVQIPRISNPDPPASVLACLLLGS